MCDVSNPDDFHYNESLLSVTPSNKLTIQIQPIEAHLDTVADQFYFHCEVDLSEYKDIDAIE